MQVFTAFSKGLVLREQMKWQIGDVTVTRVVELSSSSIGNLILPQATVDQIDTIEWIGPFVDEKLMKKISKAKYQGVSNTVINTWSRSSTIVEEMLNLTIGVHNGRQHIPIFITENMIGHKLGEFSPTRIFKGHSSKSDKLG